MFKSIFTKTLFDKRWSTLIWAIAIAIFCILVVLLFPTFKETFGKALQDTPENLRSLLGEAADYQNINGYIDIQVINQMIFLTLIMGVILGTNLLAGEESDGRLQSLLAQPVSRSKIYWHKFLAMSLLLFLTSLGLFAGTLLATLIIGEANNLNIGRFFQATLMVLLITLAYASLAFCLGALSGRKGVAGVVAGFLAFTTFMITTLASTAKVLSSVNYISPFKYFNSPSVIKNGIDLKNVMILISITALCAIVGWIVFRQRDVYQK